MSYIHSIMIAALYLFVIPSQLFAESLLDKIESNAPQEQLAAAIEEVLISGRPYQPKLGELLDFRGEELSKSLRARSYEYMRHQWLQDGPAGLKRLYRLSPSSYKREILSSLAGAPESIARSLVLLEEWKSEDVALAAALKSVQENYIEAVPLEKSLLKDRLLMDSDVGKDPDKDSKKIALFLRRLSGVDSGEDLFSSLNKLKTIIDAQGLCEKGSCSLRSALSPEMKKSRQAYLEALQHYQNKKLLPPEKKAELLSIRTSIIHDCSFSLNTRAGAFYQLVQENKIDIESEYEKLHAQCGDSDSQDVLQQAYHSFVTFIQTRRMPKEQRIMILNRLSAIEDLFPMESSDKEKHAEKKLHK